MLRIPVLFFLFLASFQSYSQVVPNSKALPSIDLTLTDGRKFNNQSIEKGIPFVLIYFSPDCEHCKQFITGLMQKEKLVRSKQILLASFVEVNTLKSFEEAMGLKKFPNVRIGTEGESYRIARGLGIRKFPYVALYDASGKQVRSFEGEEPMARIVEAMEQL